MRFTLLFPVPCSLFPVPFAIWYSEDDHVQLLHNHQLLNTLLDYRLIIV
ncbi:MAG: hypothetical protein F6K65_33515 [Moorea sp. SIO3C2]|nr:hypothetical protein [Moorena sp. SIO3C2]